MSKRTVLIYPWIDDKFWHSCKAGDEHFFESDITIRIYQDKRYIDTDLFLSNKQLIKGEVIDYTSTVDRVYSGLTADFHNKVFTCQRKIISLLMLES